MRPRDELPYIEFQEGGLAVRIYADLWEREDLQAPTAITENAVETGARLSDHQRPEPVTLKCRMLFSEEPIRGDLDPAYKGKLETFPLNIPPYPKLTPLLSPAGLTGVVTDAIGAVGDALGLGGGAAEPPTASAMKFLNGPPGRLRKVLGKLLALREKRTLFAVGSSVIRVSSMCLENLGIARSSDDGSGGALDLDFRQLQFANSETAAALPLPLEPRGQLKKDANTKAAGEVPPGPQKTGAKAIVDGLTGGG